IFTGINFFAALTYFGVLPTLVLARTGGDELALAAVQTALGAGGVVGGLILSIWGGPKRKIHGLLAGAALSFWLGDLLFATGRSTPVWVAGAFMAAFFVPFIIGSEAAIWQAKIPPAVQGRVLAVQDMLQTAAFPLGYILAGPLADYLFEPAMRPEGWLAPTFGWLVGTGPGAGMGVMFLGTAVGGTLVSLAGYLIPAVRDVETNLPDFDAELVRD
ncbi:MAG: MFS transporter, partial [Anaerolineales bacterium]|nr:MFS transporter [Anaerolineales bacterium]